jgi:ABC-type uncharacterized transport system substrate-binding protein
MHKTLLNLFLNSCSDNLKSKTCPQLSRRIENLKWLGLSVIAFVLVVTGAVAQAQQPKKVPRIGYLNAGSPSTNPARREAFRQGLRELGYVEGKDIVIEWRYAEGKPDHLPALAAELVRLKVDVIVTAGPASTRPAKEATSAIPIVMGFDSDPVGNGFDVDWRGCRRSGSDAEHNVRQSDETARGSRGEEPSTSDLPR